MASPVDPSAYKEALIFLATAGVVIPIFRKLGMSSILGFLIVGALIGPNMLGRLADTYPSLGNFVFTESEELSRLGRAWRRLSPVPDRHRAVLRAPDHHAPPGLRPGRPADAGHYDRPHL